LSLRLKVRSGLEVRSEFAEGVSRRKGVDSAVDSPFFRVGETSDRFALHRGCWIFPYSLVIEGDADDHSGMKRPFILIVVTLLFTYMRAEASEAILLTVFLKHDQSQNLTEIQELQEEQGFWKAFPPEGTTVVSWYVMMGIGQVVTLEVPASKLRDVNVALEKTAWKAFRTEFYPTYDLYPLISDKLANPAKKSP
jgi:hypothetical protein